ncbi:MAG TPA: hypothetical protein VF111_11290 [Thermoanaerobaculia bacterium]
MNAYEETSERFERRTNERFDRESEPRNFGTGATLPFDPDSTWSTPADDPDATYPLHKRR